MSYRLAFTTEDFLGLSGVKSQQTGAQFLQVGVVSSGRNF